MMKNIFCFLCLFAGLSFVACSDDDDNAYNADNAQSTYQPSVGRKVAALVTTRTVDGRAYSWKHNFSYDAHGRIKAVSSEIVHYRGYVPVGSGVSRYRQCNITQNAEYYYDGNDISVSYNINKDYPTFSEWNTNESYTDSGLLDDEGRIVKYNAYYSGYGNTGLDCTYNANSLSSVTVEDGVFNLLRDSRGNVNGHKFAGYDSNGNDSVSVVSGRYLYTSIENKTNFDFSAYFGYWEHERYIGAMSSWPYATYQLAAFGFFGSCSKYLPLCLNDPDGNNPDALPWEFDAGGYPVKYTDPRGYVTEISYVD